MSWFKRLKSDFDNLVTRLENSDALVLATIRDVETQIQDATHDLAQLDGLIATIDKEVDDLNAQVATWTARAVSFAESDEATALQCVQFINQLNRRQDELAQTRVHHTTARTELQHVLTQLKTALADLSSERQVRRNEAYLEKTNAAITRLQNARTRLPQATAPEPLTNDTGQLREQLAQMIQNSKS